jgi:FkbM family methyltransferase
MFKIIIRIVNHPLNKGNRFSALIRFIKWQIISRVYSYPILLPFTDNSSYLCWNGLTGLTGNWYCGLMEMEEMSFASHVLRKEDVFFDIGANVGAYSILVSQQVNCSVYSFEPHPKTFEYLTRNINIQNKPDSVTLLNFALGEVQGNVSFTENLDTVNHISLDPHEKSINVDIKVLDELSLPCPLLIKIDVEGFEFNVLNGAQSFLNNPNLKAIIIELNGSGLKYGISDSQIHELLILHDFNPFTYNPYNRELIKLNTYLTHNTIYIRDLNFCNSRVKNAVKLNLSNGKSI